MKHRMLPELDFGCGLAALAIGLASPAFAQSTPPSAPSSVDGQMAADVDDDIVVTGIRASLATSIREKRDSAQVMDVISSEAIGKLPDQNISESLQRITGVQINSSRGEGNSFQIRGMSQNLTLVNGRELLNADATRAIDLAEFPSEVFNSVAVYKTPTADLIEGGVGGTVNLMTPSPLTLGDQLVVSGQVGRSSHAGKWAPRASIVYSKNITDRLGILVGATYFRRFVANEVYSTQGWTLTNGIDVDGNGVNDLNVRRPTELQLNRIDDDRTRQSLNAYVEWQATDTLNLYLDTVYRRSIYDQRRSFFSNLMNDNETGRNIVSNVETDKTITVLAGEFSGVTQVQDGYSVRENRRGFSIAGGAKFKSDSFYANADIAYSRSQYDSRLNVYQLQTPGVLVYYDFTKGTDLPNVEYRNGISLTDPATKLSRVVSVQNIDRPQRSLQGKFDIGHEFDGAFLRNFVVGARMTSVKFEIIRHQRRAQDVFGIGTRPPATMFPQYLDSSFPDNFFSSASGTLAQPFLRTYTPTNVAQDLLDDFGLTGPIPQDFLGSSRITEKTHAAFFRADFSLEDFNLPLTGNFGVRLVGTRQISNGYTLSGTVATPTSIPNSYDDVLPSLNLKADLSDDLVVRFSAAKVVARPDINDLRAGINLTFSGNNVATGGNPQLKPFRASQLDLSVEWYFSSNGLLSGAFFYKDVESFIQNQVLLKVPIPGAPADQLFDFTRPVNGKGGTVKGMELAVQTPFSFLPAPFDGFGVNANYTYVDSRQSLIDPVSGSPLPLPLLSKHSYNLILYYEKGPFQIRGAYNWRAGSFRQLSRGAAEYYTSRGQLDASASYALNENVTFTLEGINLTRTPQRGYAQFPSRINYYEVNDARIFAGVRFTF